MPLPLFDRPLSSGSSDYDRSIPESLSNYSNSSSIKSTLDTYSFSTPKYTHRFPAICDRAQCPPRHVPESAHERHLRRIRRSLRRRDPEAVARATMIPGPRMDPSINVRPVMQQQAERGESANESLPSDTPRPITEFGEAIQSAQETGRLSVSREPRDKHPTADTHTMHTHKSSNITKVNMMTPNTQQLEIDGESDNADDDEDDPTTLEPTGDNRPLRDTSTEEDLLPPRGECHMVYETEEGDRESAAQWSPKEGAKTSKAVAEAVARLERQVEAERSMQQHTISPKVKLGTVHHQQVRQRPGGTHIQ